jgi:WD40 repeat protein
LSYEAVIAQIAQGDAISDIAWQPQGNLVAVAFISGNVIVYEQPSNNVVSTIDSVQTYQQLGLFQVAWSHDGSKLAIPSGNTVIIYDTTSWQISQTIQSVQNVTPVEYPEITLIDVAWKGDDSQIAGVSYAGTFEVWDVETGVQLFLMNQTGAYLYSVSWNSSSDQLATPGGAGAGIWQLPSLDVQGAVTGDVGEMHQSSWSPDGQYLATVGNDNRILVWDMTVQDFYKPIFRELAGHTLRTPTVGQDRLGYVLDVVWSPDGQHLVSSGSDGTIRVWDLESGQNIETIEVGSEVFAVDFSPDGTQIAYGGEGGMLEIVSAPGSTPTCDPVFTIADGDTAALISAITTANGTPEADTICLAENGTYTFTAAYGSSTALPQITSDITIEGNNATLTRSGAAPNFRLIQIESTGTLTLNDLTLMLPQRPQLRI